MHMCLCIWRRTICILAQPRTLTYWGHLSRVEPSPPRAKSTQVRMCVCKLTVFTSGHLLPLRRGKLRRYGCLFEVKKLNTACVLTICIQKQRPTHIKGSRMRCKFCPPEKCTGGFVTWTPHANKPGYMAWAWHVPQCLPETGHLRK